MSRFKLKPKNNEDRAHMILMKVYHVCATLNNGGVVTVDDECKVRN